MTCMSSVGSYHWSSDHDHITDHSDFNDQAGRVRYLVVCNTHIVRCAREKEGGVLSVWGRR